MSKQADVWLPSPSTGAERAPLVVYMPGWGASRRDNLALVRALMRRGYAVVALDDIAQDGIVADPADEAARTAPYDLSSDSAAAKFIAAADRRVVLQAGQVQALLDALSSDAALSARIDVGRAGMVGYSFGGATAALLGRQEPRLKAIVNLDGWQFGPRADEPVERPFLVINSIESMFTPQTLEAPDASVRHAALLNAKEQAWQMRQVVGRADAVRLLLAGGSHSDLGSGLGSVRRWVASWLAGSSSRQPHVDASKARAALDDVVPSFFDRFLRDPSGRALDGVIAAHSVLINLGPDRLPCQSVADRCALPPKG